MCSISSNYDHTLLLEGDGRTMKYLGVSSTFGFDGLGVVGLLGFLFLEECGCLKGLGVPELI
jgi:hypothetical protein